MRYFIAVAEGENISRAATQMHISQPAVGRQIRDMEEELGFPLLARTDKAVRLTAAGRIFFDEARDVLVQAAAAMEKPTAVTRRPRTSTSAICPPVRGTVSYALRAFQAHFPKVRMTLHDLSAKDMQPLLLQRKLDVALMVLRDKLSLALGKQEITRYETCIAVGVIHPLAKAKFVCLEQVASEPGSIFQATTGTSKRCLPRWVASRASAVSTTAALA